MMLNPSIRQLLEKKLIGRNLKMSLINNKTTSLWRGFMHLKGSISKLVSENVFSLQVYPSDYFTPFSPSKEFTKWAAVEVSHFDLIPDQMESFIIQEGLYAVFNYRGSSENKAIFEAIFTQWLPLSNYHLDDRPHFEILGKKYKNKDENSEEQIWIPIKLKQK